jgi:hypothetical protein
MCTARALHGSAARARTLWALRWRRVWRVWRRTMRVATRRSLRALGVLYACLYALCHRVGVGFLRVGVLLPFYTDLAGLHPFSHALRTSSSSGTARHESTAQPRTGSHEPPAASTSFAHGHQGGEPARRALSAAQIAQCSRSRERCCCHHHRDFARWHVEVLEKRAYPRRSLAIVAVDVRLRR